MQARAERHAAQGFVQFVGAGPGDPELITLRGWRALHSADVVLHDALVDRALVDGIPGVRVVETTVAQAVEDLERASLETPLLAVIGWVVTLRQRLEACIGPNPPLDSARCLESPLTTFTPHDTRSTGIR